MKTVLEQSRRPVIRHADVDEVSKRLCKRDLDAWLATLLAPLAERPRLFALWTLAAEVLDLPWQVSEPTLGLIRLQWWIEQLQAPEPAPFALGRLLQASLDHEARLALQPFVQGQAVLFENPLDAERAHAWTQSLIPVIAQAASTSDRVRTWLQVPVTTCTDRTDADESRISLLARVWGNAQLLRRAPFRRRSGLPLLADIPATRETLLATLAADLARLRRLPRPPREGLAALLPAGMAALWLKATRKAHIGIASAEEARGRTGFPVLDISQPRRQLWLLSHWLRGRIA